jgi:3-oxoacyl-[acyl-carrier-protein] synthase-3
MPGTAATPRATARDNRGVALVASGSALPAKPLTNHDLESLMDTSHDWIYQRTGITSRYRYDPAAGESTTSLATEALRRALADAHLAPADLDTIVCATMTADMPTPGVSCQVASALGCGHVGAFDLNAACSGFVFAISTAHELIRGGLARTVAVIGADTITRHCDYSTFGRGAAILFGDGAAAVILRATDDPSKGMIAQAMHSDGSGARTLFIPSCLSQFYDDEPDERKVNRVQMHGQSVFKFAVSKFPEVIQETLDAAGLAPAEVDHFVCHQANARILESARTRFGLPEHKLHINIDRLGNTVAASAPLVFDELRRAGRVHDGQKVMFIAFGAGLTWGASLWQL